MTRSLGRRRVKRTFVARAQLGRSAGEIGLLPAWRDRSRLLMGLRVIGLAEHVTAAGLVRPVFPGPPGFRRIGAIATVASIDLALPQIFDLTPQLLGVQERARVARQIDRHPYHLDERAPRRSKAVTAHQCDIVVV